MCFSTTGLRKKYMKEDASVSANRRRKNDNNAWLSYNLYFWAGYKEHPINSKLGMSPNTMQNFPKLKNYLNGAICKTGNFNPIKFPMPSRFISYQQECASSTQFCWRLGVSLSFYTTNSQEQLSEMVFYTVMWQKPSEIIISYHSLEAWNISRLLPAVVV